MGKLRYFKNLDALRAFAAIAVIVAHYFDASRMGEGSRIAKISLLGNSGVSLFFVLSGFVITRILINSTQSSGYFSSFYIRRTLRIFPLYYFSLLCYWYLPGLINKTTAMHSFSAADFYFVFYLQNFARTFNWIQTGPGHFWSLAVEEHFYLIWPAVVYFALKKNLQLLTWLSIAIIIIIHLVRVLMFKDGYNINFFTFTRLDQLVMGGLIAIIERKGYLDEKFRRQYFALFIAGLFGVAFIEFQNDPLIKEVLKHKAFGFLFAGMIMLAVIFVVAFGQLSIDL